MWNYVHLLFAKILNVIFSALNVSNTWFVSDYGSDDNDCHSEFLPRRNLQTVLDRAAEGADIYVTSDTLSLDYNNGTALFPGLEQLIVPEIQNCCQLSSSISYSLSNWKDNMINITCTGEFYQYEEQL